MPPICGKNSQYIKKNEKLNHLLTLFLFIIKMDQYLRKKITDYIVKETIDIDGNIILEEGFDPFIEFVKRDNSPFPMFNGKTKLYLDKTTHELIGIDGGNGKMKESNSSDIIKYDDVLGGGFNIIITLSSEHYKFLERCRIYSNAFGKWQGAFVVFDYDRKSDVLLRSKLYVFTQMGYKNFKIGYEKLVTYFLTSNDISRFDGVDEIFDYSPINHIIYTNPKFNELLFNARYRYTAKSDLVDDCKNEISRRIISSIKRFTSYYENIVTCYKYVNGFV